VRHHRQELKVFGEKTVRSMINQSAENELDRRRFLRGAGAAGLGAIGGSLLGPLGLGTADAAPASSETEAAISDSAILNFALNLEYLEGEFYSFAVHGHGLADNLTHGRDNRGKVVGGKMVPFKNKIVREYAREIAGDETNHVAFLRDALGSAKVARPSIDIQSSFTAAARAAGVVGSNETFDPYADDVSFLLGAFLFEDVGVTAYKGAAPLIQNKTYLGAAAGILAVEAYHAAIIRTTLYAEGQADPSIIKTVKKLSNARNSLDGQTNDDQGIERDGFANLVPTDSHSLVYSRTPGHVLNIVYLNPGKVTKGGFFPHGVNGALNTSG
jgi:hypothetical protein